MTAIAVLQCVERGLLKLDDDVTSILHELKDLQVLEGFEERSGKPILTKRTNPITLRSVLTDSFKSIRYERVTDSPPDNSSPTPPAWATTSSTPC